MARALYEDTLYALLQLALLQAAFTEAPAATLLRLPPANARGRLAVLARLGFLIKCSAGAANGAATWEMHACVRSAARRLSESLGLSHSTTRSGRATAEHSDHAASNMIAVNSLSGQPGFCCTYAMCSFLPNRCFG